MERLLKKVAIITGAGQGIGEGIALRFAREGADVAAADLNLETAERTARKVREIGRKSVAIKVDVTKAADVEAIVQKTLESLGHIDILVNNAGIIKADFICDLPEETWHAILGVNLTGVFLCSRAVARVMVKEKRGKIINITSKSGKKGGLWLSAYCASKFGAIGLTQSMALDLAPYKINVNAICPGNVFSTPMWDLLDKEYSKKLGIPPEEVRKKYRDKVPLGRECTVEDVANLAVFLASDESNYMTGQAINVTGGEEMR